MTFDPNDSVVLALFEQWLAQQRCNIHSRPTMRTVDQVADDAQRQESGVMFESIKVMMTMNDKCLADGIGTDREGHDGCHQSVSVACLAPPASVIHSYLWG